MPYLVAALIAAIATLGWLYHDTSDELVDARAGLETARATNEANTQAIERLERSANATAAITVDWCKQGAELTTAREDTNTAIMEAKSDATPDTSPRQDSLDVPMPDSIAASLDGLWRKASAGGGAASGGAALAAGASARGQGNTGAAQGRSYAAQARAVDGAITGNGR